MGQEDILKILRKNPKKYFTLKELSLKTNRSICAVTLATLKLEDQKHKGKRIIKVKKPRTKRGLLKIIRYAGG